MTPVLQALRPSKSRSSIPLLCCLQGRVTNLKKPMSSLMDEITITCPRKMVAMKDLRGGDGELKLSRFCVSRHAGAVSLSSYRCARCKRLAADEICLSHDMDAVVFCIMADT
jgi:hypothetical protein